MLTIQLLAFTALAMGLVLLPGPDTALVTRNTVTRGKRAGAWTAWGIASGCVVHAVASALGLSLILTRSAAMFATIKWVGAAYLMYLGFKAIRSALASQEPDDLAAPLRSGGHLNEPSGDRGGARQHPLHHRRSFVEGLLTNLLNPKVSLFYLMVLPQFIVPDYPVLLQSLLLASIHVLLGIVWLLTYAHWLDRMREWFSHAGIRRRIEAVTGGLMVLFGLRLAIDRS